MSTANKIRWAVRGALVLTIATLLVYRTRERPKAHGLMVLTLTTPCDLDDASGFDPAQPYLYASNHFSALDLLLRVSADGRMWLNLNEVEPATLKSLLHDIYEARREKVLFVDVSDELSFQQGADIIEQARASSPDLKVVLLTPAVRDLCEESWRQARQVFNTAG